MSLPEFGNERALRMRSAFSKLPDGLQELVIRHVECLVDAMLDPDRLTRLLRTRDPALQSTETRHA